MVQVYAMCIDRLTDPAVWEEAAQQVSPSRRALAERLPSPLQRAAKVGAGLLLLHLFGSDDTACTAEGKPYFPHMPNAHFNISHTDSWVVCATADSPVGVDAQRVTAYRPHVAERWFTDDERQWIAMDTDVRFTRLWTRKEAAAKMTGKGLVASLGDREPAYMREYTDLHEQGVYITVCTDKDCDFADAITPVY